LASGAIHFCERKSRWSSATKMGTQFANLSTQAVVAQPTPLRGLREFNGVAEHGAGVRRELERVVRAEKRPRG